MEYYYDDPTDDTDSADIPKVGYAREFTGELSLGGRAVPLNFVIGSGFYQGLHPMMPRPLPVRKRQPGDNSKVAFRRTVYSLSVVEVLPAS